MQIGQAIQNSFCYFSQHFLASSATELLNLCVDTMKTATFAILHCNGYRAARVIESTVILADMLRGALFIEGQFALDLLLDIGVGVGGDDLTMQSAH